VLLPGGEALLVSERKPDTLLRMFWDRHIPTAPARILSEAKRTQGKPWIVQMLDAITVGWHEAGNSGSRTSGPQTLAGPWFLRMRYTSAESGPVKLDGAGGGKGRLWHAKQVGAGALARLQLFSGETAYPAEELRAALASLLGRGEARVAALSLPVLRGLGHMLLMSDLEMAWMVWSEAHGAPQKAARASETRAEGRRHGRTGKGQKATGRGKRLRRPV
jgi:hypothetical protein